jgi:hypothetical protein
MAYTISIPQSPQGLGVHDTSAVPLIVSPGLDPPPALDAPIKEWAEWYAKVPEWPVFPCVGKAPAFPSAHKKNDPRFRGCKGECGKFGHGFHDATLDLDLIRFYWRQYPHANMGYTQESCHFER